MYTLYIIHVSCVVLSLTGFVGRGLMLFIHPQWLTNRWLKITPHIIDTLLLASAIGLLILKQYNVLEHNWLLAKTLVLVIYIAAGIYLFRFARQRISQICSFGIAMVSAGYIVLVALSKSAWPFTALFT